MKAAYIVRPLVYIGLFALAFYITLFDARTGTYNTTAWTEAPQEFLLFLAAVLNLTTARKHRFGRALNLALGGFALTCFAREFNNQLAFYFFRKAWVVPALAFALPTAYYAWTHRKQLWQETLALSDTFGFGVLSVGLLLLHVFSRLYGANDLWYAIMGDDYMRPVARVSEEGLELMAYMVIFLGTFELTRRIRRMAKATETT